MRLAWIPFVAVLAGCPVATAQPQPTDAAPERVPVVTDLDGPTTIAIGPSTQTPGLVSPPAAMPDLEGYGADDLTAHAMLCFWQRSAMELKTTCLLLDANAPTTTVLDGASITDELVNGALPSSELESTLRSLAHRLHAKFLGPMGSGREI